MHRSKTSHKTEATNLRRFITFSRHKCYFILVRFSLLLIHDALTEMAIQTLAADLVDRAARLDGQGRRLEVCDDGFWLITPRGGGFPFYGVRGGCPVHFLDSCQSSADLGCLEYDPLSTSVVFFYGLGVLALNCCLMLLLSVVFLTFLSRVKSSRSSHTRLGKRSKTNALFLQK